MNLVKIFLLQAKNHEVSSTSPLSTNDLDKSPYPYDTLKFPCILVKQRLVGLVYVPTGYNLFLHYKYLWPRVTICGNRSRNLFEQIVIYAGTDDVIFGTDYKQIIIYGSKLRHSYEKIIIWGNRLWKMFTTSFPGLRSFLYIWSKQFDS